MSLQVSIFDLLLDVRREPDVGLRPQKRARARGGKVQTQRWKRFQEQRKSCNCICQTDQERKEERQTSTSRLSTILFTFMISQFPPKLCFNTMASFGHARGFSVQL